MKHAFIFALAILVLPLLASAAGPKDVTQCAASKASEMAERYRSLRGGACKVVQIRLGAPHAGYISPLGKAIAVLSARGTVTLSCTNALFYANAVFTRDVSVHVSRDSSVPECMGGQVGWQL